MSKTLRAAGVAPEGLVRAGSAEDVVHTKGLRSEAGGDETDAVLVAGDDMKDRFDAFLRNEGGGGKGRHANAIAVVADAQGVNLACEFFSEGADGSGIARLERRPFRQSEEACRIRCVFEERFVVLP